MSIRSILTIGGILSFECEEGAVEQDHSCYISETRISISMADNAREVWNTNVRSFEISDKPIQSVTARNGLGGIAEEKI